MTSLHPRPTYRQEPINTSWQSGGPLGVDLSDKEQKSYSIARAIQASLTSDWSDAGLEREASADIQKRIGRAPGPGGFFLPANLSMRAPYAVGASATGGALVATNLLAGNFIEVLRAKSVLFSDLGPTLLTGLVGNADVPRRATAAQAYWLAENGAITESEGTFDKVQLRPKVVAALSNYSRLMLQQSTPDIEILIRADLAAILALAIDQAAFSGTGANNQPTGITNTSGVGSLAMGTNGGAVTIDALLDLRGKLTASNVTATGGAFVINEKTYTALAKLKTTYGEYLFSPENGMPGPGGISVASIHNCKVVTTNLLPSNGTKGSGTNLSTAIFGRWEDLVVAQWGALEILPNPYGAGFNSGSVDVRAMQTIDIGVKHPESFAVVSDLITT